MKDIKHILDWLEAIAVKVGAIGALANYNSEQNNPTLDAIMIMVDYIGDDLDKAVTALRQRIEADNSKD